MEMPLGVSVDANATLFPSPHSTVEEIESEETRGMGLVYEAESFNVAEWHCVALIMNLIYIFTHQIVANFPMFVVLLDLTRSVGEGKQPPPTHQLEYSISFTEKRDLKLVFQR
jgi:hypothetical protein